MENYRNIKKTLKLTDRLIDSYSDLLSQLNKFFIDSHTPAEQGEAVFNTTDYEEDISFLLKFMLNAMNKEEVEKVRSSIGYNVNSPCISEILDNYLSSRPKRITEKNLPISQLLEMYCTPQSGKKSSSAVQLKKRFKYQSYQDQMKILRAFLKSNKTDREWACVRLYKNWDPLFESDIRNVWQYQKEKSLATVIVKHFPVSFVLQELKNLSKLVDYWALCVKLGNSPEFTIKWDRLSIDEEFYVRSILGRGDAKILEKRLFSYLLEQCKLGYYYLTLLQGSDKETINDFCGKYPNIALWIIQPWTTAKLSDIPKVGSLTSSISRLGMKETILKLTFVVRDMLKHIKPYKEVNGEDIIKHKAESLQNLLKILLSLQIPEITSV